MFCHGVMSFTVLDFSVIGSRFHSAPPIIRHFTCHNRAIVLAAHCISLVEKIKLAP